MPPPAAVSTSGDIGANRELFLPSSRVDSMEIVLNIDEEGAKVIAAHLSYNGPPGTDNSDVSMAMNNLDKMLHGMVFEMGYTPSEEGGLRELLQTQFLAESAQVA